MTNGKDVMVRSVPIEIPNKHHRLTHERVSTVEPRALNTEIIPEAISQKNPYILLLRRQSEQATGTDVRT